MAPAATNSRQRPAEGTGLEPATGCPAPHFQLLCAPVHYRPKSSKAVHRFGVSTTRKIRQYPPLFGTVRRFGYKLATRVVDLESKLTSGGCTRITGAHNRTWASRGNIATIA